MSRSNRSQASPVNPSQMNTRAGGVSGFPVGAPTAAHTKMPGSSSKTALTNRPSTASGHTGSYGGHRSRASSSYRPSTSGGHHSHRSSALKSGLAPASSSGPGSQGRQPSYGGRPSYGGHRGQAKGSHHSSIQSSSSSQAGHGSRAPGQGSYAPGHGPSVHGSQAAPSHRSAGLSSTRPGAGSQKGQSSRYAPSRTPSAMAPRGPGLGGGPTSGMPTNPIRRTCPACGEVARDETSAVWHRNGVRQRFFHCKPCDKRFCRPKE